jgi:transposase|tara:strand:+ start:2989 stop:3513 length:525 start_codon:yes stop_codon:yes gene_type:complete
MFAGSRLLSNKVRERFVSGETIESLAAEYCVKPHKVRYALEKEFVDIKAVHERRKELAASKSATKRAAAQRAHSLYKLGVTVTELEAIFGVGKQTAQHMVRKGAKAAGESPKMKPRISDQTVRMFVMARLSGKSWDETARLYNVTSAAAYNAVKRHGARAGYSEQTLSKVFPRT